MSQTPTTYEPYTPGRPGPEGSRPEPRGAGGPDCLTVAAVVCVVVWALSGFGYFWPVWVLLPALLLRSGGTRSRRGACARPPIRS